MDVKEIIKKLENSTLSNNFRPRIIESGCIEKIPVTVNKQIILSDCITRNKSSNKLIFEENKKKSEDKPRTLKINRNKNVDLAFGMKTNQTKKPLLEKDLEPTIINTETTNEDLPEVQHDQNHENVKISINENTYGKHYVLNDNKVFEKSNFEIEFEEFEIYDPVRK